MSLLCSPLVILFYIGIIFKIGIWVSWKYCSNILHQILLVRNLMWFYRLNVFSVPFLSVPFLTLNSPFWALKSSFWHWFIFVYILCATFQFLENSLLLFLWLFSLLDQFLFWNSLVENWTFWFDSLIFSLKF